MECSLLFNFALVTALVAISSVAPKSSTIEVNQHCQLQPHLKVPHQKHHTSPTNKLAGGKEFVIELTQFVPAKESKLI
jgi:hypothetical protein